MLPKIVHIPLFASALALTLTGAGCDKEEADKASADAKDTKDGKGKKGDAKDTAGGAEAGGPAGAEGGADAPAEDAPKIDEDLVKDIAGMVENCTVSVDGCTVNDCKDGEAAAFKKRFTADGDKDKLEAIDTWAQALSSESGETQTVAANVMGAELRYLPEDPKVSPASAQRVVDALAKLPKYQSAQSIEAMTHIAVLGGKLDGLLKAATAHEYKDVLVPYVHASAMRYGRLDVFATIEAGAKSDDMKVRTASLRAPRSMVKATDAEKAKVCPWAKGYLTDAEETVFVQAGHTMVWCGGEYVDALLDEGEARLAKHEFSREMSFVFRDICFTPMGNKVAGSDEQCERNYTYLENVTNDKEIESSDRSLALFGIYYQRRDEKSLALAKKYTKSKDEEIKKRADEIVESLNKSLKK